MRPRALEMEHPPSSSSGAKRRRADDGADDKPASKKRGRKKKGADAEESPAAAAAPLPAPGDKLELPGKYSLRLKNRTDDTADYSCKISKVYTSTHLLDRVDKETRLSITGHKGYRLSRATHAVPCGDWYYEVSVELNDGGHVRVGWAQGQADMDLPCGCEPWSYSYRDVEGTKFTNAVPKSYAQPYGSGDVIGCRITLPDAAAAASSSSRRGRAKKGASKAQEQAAAAAAAAAPAAQQVVYWGQMAYFVVPHREAGQVPKHKGGQIRFYKNGEDQGVAFNDVLSGEYYPAVSLYKNARVTYNFGPVSAAGPRPVRTHSPRPY